MARVLLVDDDVALVDMLAEVFRQEGVQVATCHSSAEAVTLLREQPVDVILTDAFAPAGWDPTLSQLDPLRQVSGGTPLVLLTAYGEAATLDYAALGLAAVVLKPFDLDELVAQIQAILRERSGA